MFFGIGGFQICARCPRLISRFSCPVFRVGLPTVIGVASHACWIVVFTCSLALS
jgi:hypothetical protein